MIKAGIYSFKKSKRELFRNLASIDGIGNIVIERTSKESNISAGKTKEGFIKSAHNLCFTYNVKTLIL